MFREILTTITKVHDKIGKKVSQQKGNMDRVNESTSVSAPNNIKDQSDRYDSVGLNPQEGPVDDGFAESEAPKKQKHPNKSILTSKKPPRLAL